jgi:hydroxymethylglutaryl-CoA lyase
MNLGGSIEIVDVGPRDGLQSLRHFVETPHKVDLIRRLAAAGLKQIQIGGFVNPKAIPQFANIHEVVPKVIGAIPGVTFSVLVPNLRGAAGALEQGLKKLVFVFSVSREHNLSNVRKTPLDSIEELAAVVDLVKKVPGTAISCDLATVFGCPFAGRVPEQEIVSFARRVFDVGVSEMTLCDTVGYGNPRQVADVITACRAAVPDAHFRCHFHNTRGLGTANTLAALEAGIRSFDTAIGGLGGCPFAPGASGNMATEDTVFMLESMGLETGIDVRKLLETTAFLSEIIPNPPIESALARAGLPGERTCGVGETADQAARGEFR